MMASSKKLIRLLLLIMVLSILVQFVGAITKSLTVQKGEEEIISLNLSVDDRVLIEFTVVGHTEKTIDFGITDSQEEVKVEFEDKGYLNHLFVCDESGEYVLHFSNKGYSEDKLVTLDYEVQHYIFGIPQMLFLTLVIVLVCLGAVATFVLMGKPR